MFGKETPVEKASPEAAKPEVAKAEEAKEPEVDDLTKMPEGLSKPAQERFQKLANNNKELVDRQAQTMAAIEPFRATLQNNGVRQEQFDQAAGVIGMMNKGDYEGALKVIDQQRALIALALGKPLPGVDALADFPELRQRVEAMELDEPTALELARNRANTRAQEQQQLQQTTQHTQTQQGQKAMQTALQAVDMFANRMKATDLDYAAIEAKLLPRLPALFEGVPPAQWAQKAESLYLLIKESAGSSRTAQTQSNSLRPTGNASPAQKPKTMMEAMFGN